MSHKVKIWKVQRNYLLRLSLDIILKIDIVPTDIKPVCAKFQYQSRFGLEEKESETMWQIWW